MKKALSESWDLSGRFVLNWSKRSLCKTKLCFFEEDFKKTEIREKIELKDMSSNKKGTESRRGEIYTKKSLKI